MWGNLFTLPEYGAVVRQEQRRPFFVGVIHFTCTSKGTAKDRSPMHKHWVDAIQLRRAPSGVADIPDRKDELAPRAQSSGKAASLNREKTSHYRDDPAGLGCNHQIVYVEYIVPRNKGTVPDGDPVY